MYLSESRCLYKNSMYYYTLYYYDVLSVINCGHCGESHLLIRNSSVSSKRWETLSLRLGHKKLYFLFLFLFNFTYILYILYYIF